MFTKIKFGTLMTALVLALLVLSCSEAGSQAKFDHEYTEYAQVLDRFVADGVVDYAGLKEKRAGLDKFIATLGEADLSQSSQDEKLAFYINAYNAITLRSIIDAYPVKSIKDIDGVWDDQEWQVASQKLTLNDIEHEILRKEFQEPRIHVAVNCASVSCPPLSSEPYWPGIIGEQLHKASDNFARSTIHNIIDEKNGEAKISAIFDWFGEDFIDKYYLKSKFKGLSKKENAAINFIALHLPEERREVLSGTKINIDYMEYDWSLNEAK